MLPLDGVQVVRHFDDAVSNINAGLLCPGPRGRERLGDAHRSVESSLGLLQGGAAVFPVDDAAFPPEGPAQRLGRRRRHRPRRETNC